ncbi:hypothetical protein H5410_047071 [Solanum commersonii]|uniref:Uncharacterized protein n=1 Tax=Solanum commersonii TaxID=4109 RepID=A0A9J5XG20_SOLCO|nr:hypothetical protein H5410_047071 [Solanum commersonii]
MINDGFTIEVYVFHGVNEANQAPLELEFVPNVSDNGVGGESFNEASNPNNQTPTFTFPSNPTTGLSETSSTPFEDLPTTVPPPSPSSTVPPPPLSDPIVDNDPTDDEVEDESGFEGDTDEDIKVDSDVHQEYIDIKASKRHFKRSQRRSRGTPRLPSRRVINNGTRVTKRADVVTGDIGYTPIRGFKWKGKTTITSSNLERMRAEKVIQTRSAATATANSQSQTNSSMKILVP